MEDSAPSHRSIMLVSIVVAWIAIALRLPSCYESFWLDELHSAWSVWGPLDEVFPRAQIGNQSPFYFVGLWCWKQIIGDSEVGLRLSSVLALAASCVVLTAGVTRWSKSLAAGTATGLVLAVESNSLFFGTELRTYAFVILFSSVAIVCFLGLANVDSRHEHRRCWTVFIGAILLATLCQATAIGVLVLLPIVLCFVWLSRDRRQLLKFTILDGFLGLSVAAVGFALWSSTLGETWQQRSNWSSFAKATRLGQLWETWDWTWLILVPLGVAVCTSLITIRKQRIPIRGIGTTTVVLALVAFLATSLYWVISRFDWVPLWHRRYFIAVLPILACVIGGSVGIIQNSLPNRMALLGALIAAIALVSLLAHQQGTLSKLGTYPVALVTRGEDWRGAIEWVRSRANATDVILLDAGLLEASSWLAGRGVNVRPKSGTIRAIPTVPPTARQLEYLVFPARGPYDLDREVLPTNTGLSSTGPAIVASHHGRTSRKFLITRKPAQHLIAPASEPNVTRRVLGFGNVSVVFEASELDRSF